MTFSFRRDLESSGKRRSLARERIVFGALVLAILLSAIATVCKAQTDLVWEPSFDTNGMESNIATAVGNRKRWGFIDKSGHFVIEPTYDLVKPFKDGRTAVGIGERYFEIDKTGKILSREMTRDELVKATDEKSWAIEADERAKEEKAKYKGDIFDATGTKRLGSATESKIGNFSEGLAACTLPPRLPSDNYGPGMNRTGYIDERGRMVIAPSFYKGEEFHDGIAIVEGAGKSDYGSGYIDKNGRLLGGRYYNVARNFSHGLAVVNLEDKTKGIDEWGFIDRSGRELMGHWTKVGEFSGKVVAVRDKSGLWGFVNKDGKTVLPNTYKLVGDEFAENLTYVKTTNGYGFIDENGHTVIAPSFVDADNFSDGLAPAAVDVPESEKVAALKTIQSWRCGFIDRSGKRIADGFFAARHFSEGLAAVRNGLKWGFIDDRGVMVIPAKFDDALSFSEGLAPVLVVDRWGFIDKTGNFKIQPKFLSRDFGFEKVFPRKFSEGVAICAATDYFWRFYNRDGNEAFRLPVSMTTNWKPEASEFAEGLAVLRNGLHHHYGYINDTGRFQIEPNLESANSFSEGMAAVGVVSPKLPLMDVKHHVPPPWTGNPKVVFGFIDKKGAFVIQPVFDQVDSFHEGLAAVARGKYVNRRDGPPGSVRISTKFPGPEFQAKWGFVDRFGKQVIALEFDSAKNFSEGLAPVQTGRKWGFIDRNGKYAIRPGFDSASPFSNGLALVSSGDKFGFIDHHGAQVIEPKYSLAGSFSSGRALIVTPINSRTQISTEDRIYSKPVETVDDALEFMLQHGASPSDDCEWAGWRH